MFPRPVKEDGGGLRAASSSSRVERGNSTAWRLNDGGKLVSHLVVEFGWIPQYEDFWRNPLCPVRDGHISEPVNASRSLVDQTTAPSTWQGASFFHIAQVGNPTRQRGTEFGSSVFPR